MKPRTTGSSSSLIAGVTTATKTTRMMSVVAGVLATKTTMMSALFSLVLVLQLPTTTTAAVDASQCLADETLNDEFRALLGNVAVIPTAGSCCQADVCGIPCPAEVSAPNFGTFPANHGVLYALYPLHKNDWFSAGPVTPRKDTHLGRHEKIPSSQYDLLFRFSLSLFLR
jgi:hypothetical protein